VRDVIDAQDQDEEDEDLFDPGIEYQFLLPLEDAPANDDHLK
jgi:hypothetical protein